MDTPEIVRLPDPECPYCKGKGWIDYQRIDDIADVADCSCVGGDEGWIRQLLCLLRKTYQPTPGRPTR